jgi:hypothetical protein
MQRHETTPDDEAEALQYHLGYVRTELSWPRTIRISLQRSS